MDTNNTTEKKPNAQTEANKRWQEKNKEKKKYLSNRSISRNFIKKAATIEDLEELKELMEIRYKELENELETK